MQFNLTWPDDWHIHLRDGAYLSRTVADASKQFARAIVMPNLVPPITTVAEALAYRQRILDACPNNTHFIPLMTLYLTEQMNPLEIELGKNQEIIFAGKLYPAGATTHSEAGITKIEKLYPVMEKMEQVAMPLLIHGESTNPQVDIFDREAVFIEKTLIPIRNQFPQLKIVLEHITTSNAVDFILSSPNNTAATITAHHLLLNRNDLFVGGISPHHYCLPILKRKEHQLALIKAATSGDKRFFLGSDSAPHSIEKKENVCGCAGIYTAHAALEFYAEAFAAANALNKLEGFASFHGADFYDVPRNQKTLKLIEKPWLIPEKLSFGPKHLRPFRAGTTINFMRINEN